MHCCSCLLISQLPSLASAVESLCEGAALAGLALAVGIVTSPDKETEAQEEGHSSGHFMNWSNTHEVTTKRLHEPESLEELERIVEEAHLKGNMAISTSSLK